MLTLEIHDKSLAQRITELLQKQFDHNPERMLQELIQLYTVQQDRLQYSGTIEWAQDGLAYQKEIRRDWQ
jgi:hypothetical protein